MFPWDHVDQKSGVPTRLHMTDVPPSRRAGEIFGDVQLELVERHAASPLLRGGGLPADLRNRTFDDPSGFRSVGVNIFGDPGDGKYAWVFTGHHLTVRCDGNSEEDAAFGGPMFYGHSPNGYSDRNCFNYQTKSVLERLRRPRREAAEEGGRHAAARANSSGRCSSGRQGRAKAGHQRRRPDTDQRALVEKVMRDVLSPYRKEDADEVMQILKSNGGLEKIHLAFYQDAA